ncbi:MAG TPA: 16S rRNA (guanine(527)-N(7))-methyltransferase RsmG [Armatimonadota bacterium]|nr:16S rRNA (guanine(527)-N(7))-methyltransferase RsmG [Armatimonadota bacterium]HOJ20042.1 16S rRNA (guanine(527)-N(7))-methyltransferase RsmG [Armatimonadota bacterium]HOM81185.1 16S rRNA (guanine(527)-N(7))-methyltransferase RsmG [Armatimonadota bacterium]HPO73302.1 16S rRNA (guanine(527)-N(7))-methyltransferase RsmG [Armatimonadota bacterium]HPT96603.1 16S rRNA (guanine(527)-N(7))-methyltransferase RsmG [Armatimonadota bacterium]
MAEREEQGAVVLPDRPAEELIREGAESLGIPVGPGELGQYAAYVRELLDWNQRMNLTAVTDAREIAVKHILDSLTCFLAVSAGKGVRVLDIGTGAGFPGMVLKIHAPETPLTLLDSTRKKLDFLEHLAKALGLSGVETLHARAEDAGRDRRYRERFDLVTARAVAELRVLLELCLPFVRVGGLFLAMKGPRGDEEVGPAKRALSLLGGEIERVIPFSLPFGAGERRLILVRKRRPTPAAYPRKAGTPSRAPL